MHYLGYVIVTEATDKAVQDAMKYSKDQEWDWYRCGGRWDGHLQGPDEEKARETNNGFNFDKKNNDASRNSCKVSELPPDKVPYFFVVDGEWIAKQHWDNYAKSDWQPDGYGTIVESLDYEKRFRKAITDNQDKFLVVVDAHN